MMSGSYVPGYTKCPKCGCYATVYHTHRAGPASTPGVAVRYLKCDSCGYRFKTAGSVPASRRRQASGRPKFNRGGE